MMIRFTAAGETVFPDLTNLAVIKELNSSLGILSREWGQA